MARFGSAPEVHERKEAAAAASAKRSLKAFKRNLRAGKCRWALGSLLAYVVDRENERAHSGSTGRHSGIAGSRGRKPHPADLHREFEARCSVVRKR